MGPHHHPSLFPLLGLAPVAGRAFAEGEDKPGRPVVAMVGEACGSAASAATALVGRNVTLNGPGTRWSAWFPAVSRPHQQRRLHPASIDPGARRRLNHVIAVGRPAAPRGQPRAGAGRDGRRVARVAAEYPETRDWGIRLVTFSRGLVGDQLRTALLVLLGAVGVRAADRLRERRQPAARPRDRAQQEMAVRTAVGASRWR